MADWLQRMVGQFISRSLSDVNGSMLSFAISSR
jgi:hypothetical protein